MRAIVAIALLVSPVASLAQNGKRRQRCGERAFGRHRQRRGDG